jgi:5-methylcytosine-specific restriction endonuclease McrA
MNWRKNLKKPKSYSPTKSQGGKSFNSRRNRDRLYDGTWSKYRALFLSINPRCYACGEKATVVDHLVAHKGDKALFEKVDNHIPLCKKDHDIITATYDRKEPPDLEGKLHYLSSRRVEKDIHSSVKVLRFYGEA